MATGKVKTEENYDDIKEALEFQIDIVLRLEEERLILIKDNKIQKQHIKELEDMLTRMSSTMEPAKKAKITRDCETQASIQLYSFGVDVGVQTEKELAAEGLMMTEGEGFDDDLSDSELQYSQNQSIITVEEDFDDFQSSHQKSSHRATELFQQAESLLKKSEAKIQQQQLQSETIVPPSKKKNPTGPIKSLNFKKKEAQSTSRTLVSHMTSTSSMVSSGVPPTGGIEKENASFVQNSERRKDQQSEIIAQELLKVNRENNAMKKEMQKLVELSKKQSKEALDTKKMMDVKNEMLEKLRVEVAELSLVLNNDKFKSIRTVEGEVKKWKQNNQELKKEYEKAVEEKNELKEEVSQFKGILNKLSQEYERLSSNNYSGDAHLKEQQEQLKQRVQELEQQARYRNEQLSIKEANVQESQLEKAKILEELEYYKQVSIKSKQYAHKAIQDIDFYRNILKQHNIPLS